MYSKEKLLEMLSSDKASIRYDACEDLRVSEESSPEIINALVNATQDEESWVAVKAKLALQADVHHQLAIKMGIVEPENIDSENTQPDQSTKPIQPSLPENLAGTTYQIGQEEAKPNLVSPPAGLVRRAGALLIDMLILAAICIGIGLIFSSLLILMGFYARLISAVIALVYFSYCNSVYFDGSTPGKRAFHLWVKGSDGGYISFKRAVIRSSVLVLIILVSGWQLPVKSTNSLLILFMSVIIYGLGGAIVFLMLFNRKTGQNLDDLLVGTRVVYDGGNPIESYSPTSRKLKIGAIVVVIVLPLIIWGSSQGLMKIPTVNSSLQKIMPLYHALNQDKRYYMAGVSSRSQQTPGQQPVNALIITLWPRDNLDDLGRQKIAQDAAALAQNYISLADYNALQVQVVSGYDLGAFSQLTTWLCAPPAECSEKVVTTSILRLLTFNTTYTKGK
jgi:uncharacterized RDD family membrane protein YckC